MTKQKEALELIVKVSESKWSEWDQHKIARDCARQWGIMAAI